jgi:hypothetical protein
MSNPVWWDFVSNEQRIEYLLQTVAELRKELRDRNSMEDPLNVKTRDIILNYNTENTLLRKQLEILTARHRTIVRELEEATKTLKNEA